MTTEGPRPRLSVIVPVYNVERYLRDCLDSVQAFTGISMEVVVVDDGSTDGSASIAEMYATRDSRFRVVRRPNGGLSAARNTGLDHARGDLIFFLDSDDVLVAVGLAALIDALTATSSDFAVGKYRRFSAHGLDNVPGWIGELHSVRRLRVDPREFPEVATNVVAWSKLYRRAFLDREELRFTEGILFEDQDFAARCYSKAGTVDIVPETVVDWRVREDGRSISQGSDARTARGLMSALASQIAIYSTEAPEIVQRRRIEILSRDVRTAVNETETTNVARQAALTQGLRSLVPEVRDESWWSEVPTTTRIAVLLARLDRWDLVAEYRDHLRMATQLLPAQESEGEVYVDLRGCEEVASVLPLWALVVPPHESSVVGCVQNVAWSPNGSLDLRGWAYVRGLDSGATPRSLRAWIQAGADRHTDRAWEVVAEQCDAPEANGWARHANADHWRAGFDLHVDSEILRAASAESDILTIRLELTQGSVTRSDIVRHARPLTVTASPVDASGTRLTTEQSSRRGFHLLVRRSPVQAVDLKVQEDGATVTVRSEPSDPVVAATLVRPRDKRTVPCVLRPLGADEMEISLRFPVDPTAAQDRWELRVWSEAGKRAPVEWPNREVDDRDAVVGERGRLLFRRTYRANVEIVTSAHHPALEGVRMATDGVVARFAHVPDGATFVMESPRDELVPSSCTPIGPGSVEAHFPLAHVKHGTDRALPPPGRYFFRMVRTDGVAEVVRASANLCDTGPWRLDAPGISIDVAGDNRMTSWLEVKPPRELVASNSFERFTRARRYREVVDRGVEPERAVLFHSYQGESATDSQRAIHDELVRRGSSAPLYWGVRSNSVPLPDGATSVLIDSADWFDKLARVTHLCNNVDFPWYFTKGPHQRYLQTFHGHPFKAMGKTLWSTRGGSLAEVEYQLRRRQNYDAILAPSLLAERLYRDEFDFSGTAIGGGHARVDGLVEQDRAVRRDVVLSRLGVDRDRLVVLYAPTWRDYASNEAWSADFVAGLDLGSLLGTAEGPWTVLLRGHNHHVRATHSHRDERIVDVTDYPEINDLIHAADLAILDYSSLRFDWALTGRPAVYYVPDRDLALGSRPPLLEYADTIAGPLASTTDEVARLMSDLGSLRSSYRIETQRLNALFNPGNDGRAASRVVTQFFAELI